MNYNGDLHKHHFKDSALDLYLAIKITGNDLNVSLSKLDSHRNVTGGALASTSICHVNNQWLLCKYPSSTNVIPVEIVLDYSYINP